jgi:uncharacterized protein YyaL (SSP411 family)
MRDKEGRLLRSWRQGKAHLNGYLEDYAFFGNGLVDLYEAGGDIRFLTEARTLATLMHAAFVAPEGGFFTTSADHEELLTRHREGHDGAVPSANASAARLLARLAAHDGRDDWRAAAEAALGSWGAALTREPRAFAESLMALEFIREGPVELAFIGAPSDPALEALRRAVAGHPLPHRIIGHHDPAAGASGHPLLAGNGLVDGRSALYVCRAFACHQPVTGVGEIGRVLGSSGG